MATNRDKQLSHFSERVDWDRLFGKNKTTGSEGKIEQVASTEKVGVLEDLPTVLERIRARRAKQRKKADRRVVIRHKREY